MSNQQIECSDVDVTVEGGNVFIYFKDGYQKDTKVNIGKADYWIGDIKDGKVPEEVKTTIIDILNKERVDLTQFKG